MKKKNHIVKRQAGSRGSGYNSFRSAYGDIVRRMEDRYPDLLINEKDYFDALEALGIIERGRIVGGTFVPDRKAAPIPPRDVAVRMKRDYDGLDEFYAFPDAPYMMKRRTFGFNYLHEDYEGKVVLPVIELLDELQAELEKVEEKVRRYVERGAPRDIIDAGKLRKESARKVFRRRLAKRTPGAT